MQDTRTQDMPPPGGYPKIRTNRIPARQLFTGKQVIGGFLVTTFLSALVMHYTRKEIEAAKIERRSVHFAMFPLLLAERDREYLKQLRRNRDEEKELMKNVEGWEVGTYFGEPIYKLVPEDHFIEPSYHEYYVHTACKHFNKRALLDMLS